MNIGYMIYRAERPLSRAEQRAADTRNGELALGMSRLLRRNRAVAGPATAATGLSSLAAVPDCACSLTSARAAIHY